MLSQSQLWWQSLLCRRIFKDCHIFVNNFYQAILRIKVFWLCHINCSVILCSLVNLTILPTRIFTAATNKKMSFNLVPSICDIYNKLKCKSFKFFQDLNWFFFLLFFSFLKMLQNCANTQKQSVRCNFQKIITNYSQSFYQPKLNLIILHNPHAPIIRGPSELQSCFKNLKNSVKDLKGPKKTP